MRHLAWRDGQVSRTLSDFSDADFIDAFWKEREIL